MSENLPVESGSLSEKGTKGIMSAGAGLGLMGVNFLLGVPVVGPLLSVGLLALGAMGLIGKTKTDKVSGTVLTVAGGLGLASLFMRGFTSFLLGAGGLGLFLFGLANIAGFAAGMRKKSR